MRISDWSSDVCSSDLVPVEELGLTEEQRFEAWWIARFLEMYGTKDQGNPLTEHLDGPRPSVVGRPGAVLWTIQMRMLVPKDASAASRSAERRVGKECVSASRSRWSPSISKKKT